MSTKPVCIRRAASVEEASIIVSWLNESGIDARVVDPENPGVFAFGVTDPEGIEVYVADKETAERAEALLKKHDAEVKRRIAEHLAGPPVEATCGECGKKSSFPSAKAGTVQECQHCGSYLDVPETAA